MTETYARQLLTDGINVPPKERKILPVNHLTGREILSGGYRLVQLWVSPSTRHNMRGGWVTWIYEDENHEEAVYFFVDLDDV